MRLALGTVQFGLPYGISGLSSQLAPDCVTEILRLASNRGVTTLDTAPAYGDIESRLSRLADGLEFRINSKIPAIPQQLDDVAAAKWALESARLSLKHLGRNLKGLLFHRADDLLGARGTVVWDTLAKWAADEGVAIGLSGYDPELIHSLCQDYAISMVQLPGNGLDQRFSDLVAREGRIPRLQLRSVFLQGLLLMPIEIALTRVPAAARALEQWHQWLDERRLSPLHGALSIVKGFENMETCVIGVDSATQLTEILDVWDEVGPARAEHLSNSDPQVIDPRLWKDWRQ